MSKTKKGATQGAPPKARKKKPGGAQPPTQRQLRVGEEIRHVLSGVFTRGEFRDPDLAGQNVTVTEVRISPDLKHATAFVARLGRSDIESLLPALKRAAPYFRAQVAHELRLRVAADISFQPDTALEYAVHIDRVLHLPEVARDLTHKPGTAEADQTEEQAE
jgi:ribosome-binding factor A